MHALGEGDRSGHFVGVAAAVAKGTESSGTISERSWKGMHGCSCKGGRTRELPDSSQAFIPRIKCGVLLCWTEDNTSRARDSMTPYAYPLGGAPLP